MNETSVWRTHWIIIALIFSVFAILLLHLQPPNIADSEAANLWLIQPQTAEANTFPRSVIVYLRDAVGIVTEDNPVTPVYSLSLDLWAEVTGTSLFSLRLFSLLWTPIILGGIYALMRTSYSPPSSWLNILGVGLFATSGFILYFGRVIDVTTMFFAVFVVWLLIRRKLVQNRNALNTTLFLMASALLMYTHYFGIFAVITHLVVTEWMAVSSDQQYRSATRSFFIRMIILVALLVPILIQLPDRVDEIFQPVLIIGSLYLLLIISLPLLISLLQEMGLPSNRQVTRIAGLVGILLIGVQLIAYPLLFPSRPGWNAIISEASGQRDSLQPMIINYPEQSAISYYMQLYGLNTGLTLNVQWREFSDAELSDLLSRFESLPSLWFVSSLDNVQYDTIRSLLSADREIGYEAQNENGIILRFDRINNESSQSPQQPRWAGAV